MNDKPSWPKEDHRVDSITPEEYRDNYLFGQWPILEDGEPCHHRRCLNHKSHPCEGCGRIQANSKLTREYYIAKEPNV